VKFHAYVDWYHGWLTSKRIFFAILAAKPKFSNTTSSQAQQKCPKLIDNGNSNVATEPEIYQYLQLWQTPSKFQQQIWSGVEDRHFNILRYTPSFSSVPSGTHHLQRRWLWSTLPVLDNISSCHRSAHKDTIWPPSSQSVVPSFGTVYLRHCVLLTISNSSAGI